MARTKTEHSTTKLLRKIPMLPGFGEAQVTRELEKLQTLYAPLIEKARKDNNQAEEGAPVSGLAETILQSLRGLRGSFYVTPWSLNRAILVPSHPEYFDCL
jgi:hypothetical protein